MLKNKRYYIISTFRDELNFDTNYDNLLNEFLFLKGHDIDCEIVAGKYKGVVEYSLLIEYTYKTRKEVFRIMNKYFQECFLDVTDNDAYFVDKDGMVLSHMSWLEVGREEALENIDFMYQPKEDKFYIAK